MRYFFFLSTLLLVSPTAVLVATMPEHHSAGTVMYRTSDPNPARGPQMAEFEKWMTENGYPPVDLKLDVNYMTGKVIIQSVSGVAGDTFGRLLVSYPDAVPANQNSVKTPGFPALPDHPGEHHAHEKYVRATVGFGVGAEYSPFVLPVTIQTLYPKYVSGIESRAVSVEQTLRSLTEEINRATDGRIGRDPELKAKFDKAMLVQQQIDRLKTSKQPVPLHLIANPIHRRLQGIGK